SAIEDGVRVSVDLVQVEFRAQLDCVCANNPGIVIHPLHGVIDLCQSRDVLAEGEVVERNVLDAFNSWSQGNNPRCARGASKSLRDQTRTHTTYRLARLVRIAHVTETKFVDHIDPERLGHS